MGQASIKEATDLVDKPYRRLKLVDFAHLEALRFDVARALRYSMNETCQTIQEIHRKFTKDETTGMDSAAWEACIRSLNEACPPKLLPERLQPLVFDDADVKKLFKQLAGERLGIHLQRFTWVLGGSLAYRAKDKVEFLPSPKDTTEGVRVLDVGDFLQASDVRNWTKLDTTLQTPATNSATKMSTDPTSCKDGYFKCRSHAHGVDGFVKVSAEGTPSLEPWSLLYVCVKETVFTDALPISSGRTLRRLHRGEIVEALDFEQNDVDCSITRIQCRAFLDAKQGWASLRGNAGQSFLEPLHL